LFCLKLLSILWSVSILQFAYYQHVILCNRIIIIPNLRHDNYGFSELLNPPSVYLESFAIRIVNIRIWKIPCDVTENCCASSSHHVKLHYEFINGRDKRCDNLWWWSLAFDDHLYITRRGNTKKIVGYDATSWPCRLTKRIFRQTDLINV